MINKLFKNSIVLPKIMYSINNNSLIIKKNKNTFSIRPSFLKIPYNDQYEDHDFKKK
jgi:hypothetical protein